MFWKYSSRRACSRVGPRAPECPEQQLPQAGSDGSWRGALDIAQRQIRSRICVERLRAGGAILFGKTTTPEFALLGRTFSHLKPSTRNPWDLRLT
ncbi:amidase family protein, partial [Bradyrhizobium sp. SRL28]|uniref:amidase family protein n=1 Tax=Bradyrhizobium sp. SRL28 TaxID=2836178 RepID=UPI0035AFEFC5